MFLCIFNHCFVKIGEVPAYHYEFAVLVKKTVFTGSLAHDLACFVRHDISYLNLYVSGFFNICFHCDGIVKSGGRYEFALNTRYR